MRIIVNEFTFLKLSPLPLSLGQECRFAKSRLRVSDGIFDFPGQIARETPRGERG